MHRMTEGQKEKKMQTENGRERGRTERRKTER